MKVVDIGPPIEECREDFDKRQKSSVGEGACFLCSGWGYPDLYFSPEKREGKWAIRLRSKACKVCGGSGLDPKKHSEAEVDAGRAYHKARINKLLRWVSQDAERRAKEASRG